MNKHLHVSCQLFHYALLVRGYSGYETIILPTQLYKFTTPVLEGHILVISKHG